MSFVHEDADFDALLQIVAGARGIGVALVEKDYWVTHTLWALHEQGFEIWFKGGTSLSKGFGLIERFSEDLDFIIPGEFSLSTGTITAWLSELAAWVESESGIRFPRDGLGVEGPLRCLFGLPSTWLWSRRSPTRTSGPASSALACDCSRPEFTGAGDRRSPGGPCGGLEAASLAESQVARTPVARTDSWPARGAGGGPYPLPRSWEWG